MIVYYHGSPDKPVVPELTIFVAPAAMVPEVEATNDDWWQKIGNDKRPKEFAVKFFSGQAEVDDELGNFMLKHKLAHKSKLIIPAPWER